MTSTVAGRRPRELAQGIAVVDLLARSGLAASKGEARRLIRGGGARLNDSQGRRTRRWSVTCADLVDGQLLLASGRKRHARVRAGLRLSQAALPGSGAAGVSSAPAGVPPNRSRIEPGASTESGLTQTLGSRHRALHRVGHGEGALALAAGEERADQRDLADHPVDRVERHDGARQIELLAGEVDPAVDREAELRAGQATLARARSARPAA